MSEERQRVIVTGAAEGLGKAIADAFLADGASVAGIDINDDVLRERSAERERGDWHGFVADLTSGSQTRESVRAAIGALGGVTALVNGVGGMRQPGTGERYLSPTLKLSDEQIDDTFALTVRSPLVASIEAAGWMIDNGVAGSIVNIGSDFGERAAPTRVPYGFSKAAITSVTQSLAAEWGEHGIRVNEMVPYARTDSMRARMDDPKSGPQMLAKVALRRFAEAEEIAPVVVFMCSPGASYMSGAKIRVDGGRRF